MGVFDPAAFLDTTLTEVNDTKIVPVPAGEYTGITGEVTLRQATSKDGSQVYTFLELPIEIDNAEVKAFLGRDKISVRYSAGLEFNANGGLDTGKGKNVGLGRIRQATGQNVPGQPFNMRMLAGRPLKVTVKHRVQGEDIFADVASVAPIA